MIKIWKEFTVEEPMKITPDIFHSVIDVYIEYPEYFCPNSICRADLMYSSATEKLIKRRLVPKLKRNPGNFVFQNIQYKNSTEHEYNFTIELEPEQGFYPFILHFSVSYHATGIQLEISPLNEFSTVKSPKNNKCLYSIEGIHGYFSGQLDKLVAYMEKDALNGKYIKRVHHDKLVPKDLFQDLYFVLKIKYGAMVCEQWKESGMATDPSKHVFEDLSIATFLILCFILYSPSSNVVNDGEHNIHLYKERFGNLTEIVDDLVEINANFSSLNWGKLFNVSFIDMGCGNGLLSYILNSLGVQGYGLDVWERPLWKELVSSSKQSSIGTNLKVSCVYPDFEVALDLILKDVWLIGNHSDELTPWIPLIARDISGRHDLNAGFIVIPCCFHDLYGYKNYPSKWTIPANFEELEDDDSWNIQEDLDGKYAKYLRYIEGLGRSAGFTVRKEHLRIPSTKNIALMGRLKHGIQKGDDRTFEYVRELITSVPFKCRVSDREKSLTQMARMQAKQDSKIAEIEDGAEISLETDETDFFNFDSEIFKINR